MARTSAQNEEFKQLICILHDEIYSLAKEVEETDFLGCAILELPEKMEELKENMRQIQSYSLQAKKRGQAMENRMREYKAAIEKLGFKRIESGKDSNSRRRRS